MTLEAARASLASFQNALQPSDKPEEVYQKPLG